MGVEMGVVVPASLEMDLLDLRMKEEDVARSRTWCHVVMLFVQRGVRRGRSEACVLRGENSQYACLYVWGSVMCVALSVSDARRVLSCLVKWAWIVEAIGLVRERGGM
jgi:hypothetical protein